MNKLFKNFMLALMIIPCVCAFTACGETPKSQLETKATLNTDGNYEEKTASDVSAIINDADMDCESLLNGYKMSFNMSMSEAGSTVTMEATMIQTIKEVKQDNQVVSETTTTAMSAKLVDGQDNATFKMYDIDFDDKVDATKSKDDMYFEIEATKTEDGDIPNGKYKVKTTSKFAEYKAFATISKTIVDSFSIDGLMFDGMLASVSNSFEIATDGNTKKVKITVPATSNTIECVMYMVFENNVFQGFVLKDVDLFGMTISATLCAFNDTIDLPDFSGYSEL